MLAYLRRQKGFYFCRRVINDAEKKYFFGFEKNQKLEGNMMISVVPRGNAIKKLRAESRLPRRIPISVIRYFGVTLGDISKIVAEFPIVIAERKLRILHEPFVRER